MRVLAIDTALEASERGIRAVKISFAGLLVTAIIQIVIVVIVFINSLFTGMAVLVARFVH